jgi:hypothetical protein
MVFSLQCGVKTRTVKSSDQDMQTRTLKPEKGGVQTKTVHSSGQEYRGFRPWTV